MLVQGIHHVCIRCEKSEIEKVKDFISGSAGYACDSFLGRTGTGRFHV